MGNFDYHFSGYATRNDLLCGDGRTIRQDAFKDCDGATVPLIWNHQHNDPDAVLGHALLENRSDGVYAYCSFNDTEQGKHAKKLVMHGDVRALSICANKLKHIGSDVVHGVIRELSLVLAGANPGAYIDYVMAHSDDSEDLVYANYDESALMVVCHSADSNKESTKENEKMAEEKKATENESGKEKTIADVYNEFTEEQKKVVQAMIGMALEDAENGDEEDKVEHSEGGTEEMKHNVFETTEEVRGNVLTHADQMEIIATAKKASVGSLQEAIKMFMEESGTLAHGLDLGDSEVLEELLPDHKLLNPGAPTIHDMPDQSWVMGVINKVKKSPISRIRTRYAEKDAEKTREDYRAKGYKKGNEKELNANLKLIGRKTEPTTIYIKEELNRDDIIDITDFDVVNYTWNNMKTSLYETIALQTLVGDGRENGHKDDISEDSIRPIWKDAELYTHHVDVDIEKTRQEIQGTDTNQYFGENFIYAEAIVTAALYSRETFKGSGTPDLYCAPHLVNVMLLARDRDGRRMYNSKADLARALNVNSIIEIEQFAGLTRTDDDNNKKKLLGLFVNLADYQYGSTKGGEITKFDDFDIDFNKYKYLMETRLSGALVKLHSAIALEEPVADEVAG